MARRRRRRRDAPAPLAVAAGDGDGYLIGLELEARLLGRIRLLTVEATAAVSDGTAVVLDVPPRAVEASPAPRPRPDRPATAALGPGRPRAGLREAAAMVREAREILSSAPGTPR